METVAITIEDDVLERLDRLAHAGTTGGANRSRIIRAAVREYVSRLEPHRQEAHEAAIVRRHRRRRARQAGALVHQQAKP